MQLVQLLQMVVTHDGRKFPDWVSSNLPQRRHGVSPDLVHNFQRVPSVNALDRLLSEQVKLTFAPCQWCPRDPPVDHWMNQSSCSVWQQILSLCKFSCRTSWTIWSTEVQFLEKTNVCWSEGWTFVTCEHQRGRLREGTGEENGLDGVEENKNKLNELDCSDVFLPPEILLHPGAEGSTHVVEVHHSVNSWGVDIL